MFCSKCGKEINDDAVVCVNCGCSVLKDKNNFNEEENESASKSSVALGIIGIICAFLIAIVGHICSIISIILGIIDCTKHKKPTGLILGIVGEVLAIFSSIIGAAIGAAIF